MITERELNELKGRLLVLKERFESMDRNDPEYESVHTELRRLCFIVPNSMKAQKDEKYKTNTVIS